MSYDVVDTTEIDNDLHRSIFEKAEPFLRTRHNDVHAIISYRHAKHILAMEGGNSSIVLPAVLLHDVGWSAVPEERQLHAFGPELRDPDLRRRHETEGAKLARAILSEMSYPQDMIRRIERIIDVHDSRTDAIDIDDLIVKESDRLFRYSRTGFAIIFQGFNREPREYLAWLSKVAESWFCTGSAYRLAHEEIKKREKDLDKNFYSLLCDESL